MQAGQCWRIGRCLDLQAREAGSGSSQDEVVEPGTTSTTVRRARGPAPPIAGHQGCPSTRGSRRLECRIKTRAQRVYRLSARGFAAIVNRGVTSVTTTGPRRRSCDLHRDSPRHRLRSRAPGADPHASLRQDTPPRTTVPAAQPRRHSCESGTGCAKASWTTTYSDNAPSTGGVEKEGHLRAQVVLSAEQYASRHGAPGSIETR